MTRPETPCALCGLDASGSSVTRQVEGEEKRFCCLGCASVYQIAHDNGILDQVLAGPAPEEEPGDWVFRAGETTHFSLQGMWCASCALAAEQLIRRQPGILDAEVSFAAERGRMRFDPDRADPEALFRLLNRLGYRAETLATGPAPKAAWWHEGLLLQLVAAVAFEMHLMTLYLQVLYPHYATGDTTSELVRRVQYLCWLLATPLLFYGGSSFLRGAWRALRARTATMDTLVSLGTLSAYTYSAGMALTGAGAVYFDSVGMITTFVLIGRYLERIGVSEARKDVRHLLALQPENAWRQTDGAWEEVQAACLVPGDVLLVKPGGRVPADAEVLEGRAAVDESLLTGESAPAARGPGDAVLAGTVVRDSALVCRVAHPPGESRLAGITRLVEETLSAKPPIQRLADRAAGWFAGGVLLAAALTAVGWHLTGHAPGRSLLAAVAVLVVACPCSLGLATPLAVAIALGRAARAGVLLRSPEALETAAAIDRVALDKTGTVTEGRMSVVGVEVGPGRDQRGSTGREPGPRERLAGESSSPAAQGGRGRDAGATSAHILSLAAAVEQFSEHPVARAIVSACAGPLPMASGFATHPGEGASADVQGAGRLFVGKRAGPGSPQATPPPRQHDPLMERADEQAAGGATIAWVSLDGRVAGFVAVRDTPNPTAAEALRQLRRLQVRAVLLSGDAPPTVEAVARELGLKEYAAGVSPEAKAAQIRAWRERGERVAMAGDGVNDAPALAQADLSFTVAGGAAVAGETSDVILAHRDLTRIPWLLALARRTRRVMRWNLGWALGYNAVAVPLAMAGTISPLMAAVAMAASSLLVVGNSLRLRGD